MTAAPPINFTWDGEAFRPASKAWAARAARYYDAGQNYELVEYHTRSAASHSHYFAALNDAWSNLSDGYAQEFPSVEHLRKWALIKAGYCDSQTFVCADPDEAMRLVVFVKPTAEFDIVVSKGTTVARYSAKSQSFRAMGKEQFQKSKTDVLAIVAGLIGTTVKALEANTGQSGDGQR